MASVGDFRDVKHRTIFHELLESPILPSEDKTVDRLWQEAQLLLAAGTVTTATSISSALVYLLLDPVRLKVLLVELEIAMPDISKPPRETDLERLPYLVSITNHSPPRLSPRTSHSVT
jgi:cytochrome P450